MWQGFRDFLALLEASPRLYIEIRSASATVLGAFWALDEVSRRRKPWMAHLCQWIGPGTVASWTSAAAPGGEKRRNCEKKRLSRRFRRFRWPEASLRAVKALFGSLEA